MVAKRKPSRKADKTGRSTGSESFFQLHSGLARSLVIRSLSGPAMKIWIELHARHNGFNNGRIGLSYGEGAKLLHMSKTTVSRAFAELQEKGLIKQIRPGERQGRLSAEWEVTDLGTERHQATREYKNWTPPPKAARTPSRCKTRPTKSRRRNASWYPDETQRHETVP
jgi:DNA-binding transcriptional ArsR family regulator